MLQSSSCTSRKVLHIVEKSTHYDLRSAHYFFPRLHQICSRSYIDITPSCALGEVAVGTSWICSFQIVLLLSVRSASLFFAQSYTSSQSDLCQCYLHFKIEFAFYRFVTFASDSENKFWFHSYCFLAVYESFYIPVSSVLAECCRVWVQGN